MATKFVTQGQVAKLLKSSSPTIRSLRQNGSFPNWNSDSCPVETLDTFLAVNFVNVDIAPRWGDLVSGRVVLLSQGEAIKRHCLAPEDLDRLRTQFRMPHLLLPTVVHLAHRYPVVQLASYVAKLRSETDKLTAWLAGYVDAATFRAAGLRYGIDAAMDIRRRISHPRQINEWQDDCRAAKSRPLTYVEIASLCGKNPEDTLDLLIWRGVPYVRPFSGELNEALFSPLWAFSVQDKYRRSPRRDIGRLFGVLPRTAGQWPTAQANACALGHKHKGRTGEWYAVCWLAFLTADVSLADAHRVHAFWSTRLIGGVDTPLLSCTDVAKLYGMHRQSIQRAATSGAIPSVRTPGGTFRFVPEWLT